MSQRAPPAGIDLEANQGPRIISSMIALIILPTIFVTLRLISRKISRAGFSWDDALVVGAFYAMARAYLSSSRVNQFGVHLWALDDEVEYTRIFLKILYIFIIFYYSAVTCVKFAILAFYHRIFPLSDIKRTLYVAYMVVASYGIGTLASTTFQCQPIHGYWDVKIPRHCMSGDYILLIPGIVNAVLDFLIVAIPLPLLWRLRTDTYQKWVLTGIFACAGFVCFISIIRLIVVARLHDFDVTWNYVNAAIWSAAEPCRRVFHLYVPSSPYFYEEPHVLAAPYTLNRPRWGHEVEVKGGREKKATGFPGFGNRLQEDEVSLEEMVPQGGIKVKSEVVVTSIVSVQKAKTTTKSTRLEWKNRHKGQPLDPKPRRWSDRRRVQRPTAPQYPYEGCAAEIKRKEGERHIIGSAFVLHARSGETNSDTYVLKRSYIASARLNLQHLLWVNDFGGKLLHPDIPIKEEELRLADVGTGTGMWLLDFARQYPRSVQLDGLDISLDQVPHPDWLPSNVSFHEYSVYDEPRADLKEKYDIIHVRHLLLVVKQNDPSPVLDNVLKMLKPGGYLQWGEYDLASRTPVVANPGCSTAELERFSKQVSALFPSPTGSWTADLDKAFRKAGLQDVFVEAVWSPRSHLPFHNDLSLMGHDEAIEGYARQGRVPPETINELRIRHSKAAEEMRRGGALNYRRLAVVGRKPA
ncbi:hypothetical protein G7Y79_00049g084650 [Physcia stellaris]|nr:hypothetical protein G7Y79_00049g084650 [Physcia stellaris]